MNTQSQAQAAGSESIRRVPDLVGTATVVDESTADHIVNQVEAAAASTSTKKSIFGRSKDHVSRNKGKYSFAAGVAVGAAAGVGYCIWKMGGSDAAAVELIGDAPV